jgi:hypothetical protein
MKKIREEEESGGNQQPTLGRPKMSRIVSTAELGITCYVVLFRLHKLVCCVVSTQGCVVILFARERDEFYVRDKVELDRCYLLFVTCNNHLSLFSLYHKESECIEAT